jgi:hypothetical protein
MRARQTHTNYQNIKEARLEARRRSPGHTFPAGFRVHSSAPSDFLAPMLRSNLSVVERSAEMPFSSCPVDRKPLADRGSDSIARSFFF